MASSRVTAEINGGADCEEEPLMLHVGAGWDVEALCYGSGMNCRRYVFVDCIPNRHLYWKPGESGYEISRSEDVIVGMIRYKLALLEMPVETQHRMVDSETGKAMVRWTLQNGYELRYFFDMLFPGDFCCSEPPIQSNRSFPRELCKALSDSTILFMKGYPPLPFDRIVESCPKLSVVVSTDDNIRSVKRNNSELLNRFQISIIKDLDLETIQACSNSFEVVQKCIHMF
uniref:Uncharacterized protein n=1 Tax=Odontella aurita TaxID=265563 RepID=A0A7S4JWU3_9STRA|mmetsp:Transcript_55853/g.167399  ORF Transcript_55853/g.167399 Transcript_55853/m.167399 type:complete len:229 (+) Transcript_55853:190-876(+)